MNALNSSQANRISEMEVVIQKHEFDSKSTSNKYQQTISALENEIQKLELKVKDYEVTLR